MDDYFTFDVTYKGREVNFELPSYCTIGVLKKKIYDKLNISPAKQVIHYLDKNPESDQDTLEACCSYKKNYLVVYNSNDLEKSEEKMEVTTNDYKEFELLAAMDFIEYFSRNFDDKGITFHACCLEDAISEACFTSIEKRKVLLLYLHNKNDKFSDIFAEHLVTPEVKEIINERFFLLGWNVEQEIYHPGLIEALNTRSELSVLKNFIKSKICSALLIVPIKNSFTLYSSIKNKVSKKDFLETLEKAKEFLVTENSIEKDLEEIEQSENDIGSVNFQQIMLDMLGDRDYDSFEYDEHNLLKNKIGYSLFGPPENKDGYTSKQLKRIETLYKVIVRENNRFAKWIDRVVISFIYNCIEPLPSEKQKRAKKFPDYNPKTDLTPIPLFILRKCKNSTNPCRVIIDDNGRVYNSWNEYITRNKLHECEMILPVNGRYKADVNGIIILERHLSPACGIGVKILEGTDIASTALGLVSGGIFIAAAVPAITVAPVALVAAGATGAVVGVYSLGRSAFTLYDRTRHKETLSFANSEARGAYLSIVAGSLGFVGAGANMAVSQLAARGVNLSQGATITINIINMTNLGAGGIGIVNSSYDVIDQWLTTKQKPSALQLVQLGSSILFFGHAVYNFKLAGTVIEETQARTIQDYQESLRSNRHRKTFSKLMKETIRQNNGDVQRGRAEVIKTVTRIGNKDDVFATLTRLNKKLNENKVKFSASNGEIKLNGVTVDMVQFNKMNVNDVVPFLQSLYASEPAPSDVQKINTKLQTSIPGITRNQCWALASHIGQIFCNVTDIMKDKITNTITELISELDKTDIYKEFCRLFPGFTKFMKLVQMVASYFQQLINNNKEETNFDSTKQVNQVLELVTKDFYHSNCPSEALLKELIGYFHTWFAKEVVDFEEGKERKEKRRIHSGVLRVRDDIKCPQCGGVY